MAANRSLEEQKKKLHSILLSRRDGYTNTAHILRDLRDDFGHDGIALAQAHGYHSFQTFLESASMREYCRCAEELRTTTVYYGIGNDQTRHIEREMQLSLPAKLEKADKDIRKFRRQIEAKNSEISKMSHTVEKMAEQLKEAEIRLNETMTSDSNGLNPRRQCGFLQPKDSNRSGIPCDPRFVPAKGTDTQIDCTDQDEKAVQTEDQIQFTSISTTLAFLKEPHAKGQAIDRKNQELLHSGTRFVCKLLSYSDYDGNITVKDMINEIFWECPIDDDIYNYEPHMIHYFDPEYRRIVEVSNDTPVEPDGQYWIDMSLRGGEAICQSQEKLQNSEAQLRQTSEENQQLKDDLCALKKKSEYTQSCMQNLLNERNFMLYNSKVSNRELMESNRNLKAKLGQLDLDRLKVFLQKFAENAEISQDLLNTMSAELEAEQKRQSENVKNTEMSANANLDMFDLWNSDSDMWNRIYALRREIEKQKKH